MTKILVYSAPADFFGLVRGVGVMTRLAYEKHDRISFKDYPAFNEK